MSWYCKGVHGIKPMRMKAVRANSLEELEQIVQEFLATSGK